MVEYSFTLKFDVPIDEDLENLSARLYENGCDDAVIGIGVQGRIVLYFERQSDSASNAVMTALEDTKNVFPDARLTEASPDLVGITDIAKILNCSRQNVQKMIVKTGGGFPSPVYVDLDGGNRASLWHLASVLDWLKDNDRFEDKDLYDLSSTTMTINLANKPTSYRDDLEDRIRELVA